MVEKNVAWTKVWLIKRSWDHVQCSLYPGSLKKRYKLGGWEQMGGTNDDNEAATDVAIIKMINVVNSRLIAIAIRPVVIISVTIKMPRVCGRAVIIYYCLKNYYS